ncbi:hypothetical protein Efla_001032 [Eimeria flavescens]
MQRGPPQSLSLASAQQPGSPQPTALAGAASERQADRAQLLATDTAPAAAAAAAVAAAVAAAPAYVFRASGGVARPEAHIRSKKTNRALKPSPPLRASSKQQRDCGAAAPGRIPRGPREGGQPSGPQRCR